MVSMHSRVAAFYRSLNGNPPPTVDPEQPDPDAVTDPVDDLPRSAYRHHRTPPTSAPHPRYIGGDPDDVRAYRRAWNATGEDPWLQTTTREQRSGARTSSPLWGVARSIEANRAAASTALAEASQPAHRCGSCDSTGQTEAHLELLDHDGGKYERLWRGAVPCGDCRPTDLERHMDEHEPDREGFIEGPRIGRPVRGPYPAGDRAWSRVTRKDPLRKEDEVALVTFKRWWHKTQRMSRAEAELAVQDAARAGRRVAAYDYRGRRYRSTVSGQPKGPFGGTKQ